MDHSLHPHDDQELASMPTPTRGAKRSRENETPSQRHKREKAAERQRRKRERDRQAASAGNATGASPQELMTYPPPAIMDVEQHSQMLHHAHPPPPPQHVEYADPAGLRTVDSNPGEHDMTADEVQRRERVRAAARERQRKHRALVKARKMRELGLDMGNEVMGTVEDLSYRVDPEGAYTPVLVPQHEPTAPPPPHPHPHIPQPQPQHQQEPAFPQNQPLGGQTFASTLLLSFSCAPLLKQHLLRTLSMTNDELASLEPVIAQAWDQWDHDRRLHYAAQAEQAAKVSGGYDGTVYPGQEHQAAPNEFRARFRNQLVAPSPFSAGLHPPAGTAEIDPNLTGSPAGAVRGHSGSSIDGELAQGEEEDG